MGGQMGTLKVLGGNTVQYTVDVFQSIPHNENVYIKGAFKPI